MARLPTVGWIGLGAMGQPLCRHLLAAGHVLTAFDVRSEALTAVVADGALAGGSIGSVAGGSEIVFSSLPDDGALCAVALGPDGVIANAAPGTVFVDTSTVSVEVSAQIGHEASARGVPYLRCALSGTSVTAKAAGLTIFASGPADAYARVEPLLACFGPRRFRLGEAEEARAMKLVVNLMVGVSAAMLGEALALGEKAGLDWQRMLDVIDASAVASPFVKYKVPLLRTRDFSPQFTAQLMAKDLSLIVAAAGRAGVAVPLATQTLHAFRGMAGRGWEQEDMMAILKVCEDPGPSAGDD